MTILYPTLSASRHPLVSLPPLSHHVPTRYRECPIFLPLLSRRKLDSTPMLKPEDILDRIAATASANGGRSKLYRWMRANHDAFAQLIDEHRPNWQALAGQFAKEGLTGPTGEPLKADSVRRTWYRARQDHAKARTKRAMPGKPPPVEAPAAAIEADKPVTDASETLADLRRQMDARSGRKG